MNPDRWESAKRLFHEALERPPGERERFVRDAAAGDGELRDEVIALLQAQHRADELFADVARSSVAHVLSPGARIGSYEIEYLLGAGGMGEVYRARDLKLRRDVAIKVLPPSVSHDSERLRRFEREAHLLASLNHPNIAAIYGFEQTDPSTGAGQAVTALVLELVEGPTLAERIARGPVSVPDALAIARQVADALEAAHERGIIHRDLKPANVKLTPDGIVKVLDFGLAKAVTLADDVTRLPATNPLETREGVIAGTAPYMSPEQARAQTVDKRADIWAFGCLLYELLTGTRAFAGDTMTDVLAAVVNSEPDWSALPADTPASIRRLLERCLQKDPKRRLRDIGDADLQIEQVRDAAPSRKATARVRKSRERVRWMAAMLIVVVGMTTLYFRRAPAPQGSPAVSRLSVALPAGDRLGGLNNSAVALSPGGTELVYVGLRDGEQELYLRLLDGLDSTAISGTEGATGPFFSPDGGWIGFFALGKLKKVRVAGGAVEILCDAPGRVGMGASWGADNNIYFTPSGISGLWKVSASGGTPTEVTRLDRSHGEVSHRWPQVLPGGKAVLFTVWTGPGFDEQRIEVQSLQTGERRVLVRGGTAGRYVASGHLVYARADALMAVRMDLDRLEAVSDTPVLLTEQVRVGGEGATYAVSDSGQLVYAPGNIRRYERELVWVDRKGGAEAVPLQARNYSTVALSPDGRQAAVQIAEGAEAIWIYDFDRTTLTRLTTGTSSSQLPVWTPDGSRVVYRGTRLGVRKLFWKPADAATEEEPLPSEDDSVMTPGSWSHDGKWLAFTANGPSGGDLWALSLEDRKLQSLLQTPSDERSPQFSPDGRWLAYVSNESGRDDVYVKPFPGPPRKWPISTEGGSQPRWSRGGRELFYRSGDKMMVVDITSLPSFVAGSPRLLFEFPFATYGDNLMSYGVAPDGQRFLGIRNVHPEPPANQINIVLNWFEELKRLVPTK
jgi:eukaryotic-like serine/threonine-protein kinase